MLLKGVDEIVADELKPLDEFRILVHGRASEFLEELIPEDEQRWLRSLEDLFSGRQVAGEENTFRLRVGN